MRNNRLSLSSALVAGLIIAQITGCAGIASDSLAPPDGVNSALTTDEGQLGGTTRFSKEAIADLVEDDFWDTGVITRLDDDGRLVYSAKAEAVNNPQLMREEIALYQQQRASRRNNLYVDPVVGRPLTRNGAIFFGARTDQRMEDPRLRNAIPDPRPAAPPPTPRRIERTPRQVVPQPPKVKDGNSKR